MGGLSVTDFTLHPIRIGHREMAAMLATAPTSALGGDF